MHVKKFYSKYMAMSMSMSMAMAMAKAKAMATATATVVALLVMSLAPSIAVAEEISILQSKLYSSIKINIDEKDVSQVIKSQSQVEIVLTRNISEPINNIIDDEFIYSITSTGNSIIVRAQKGAKVGATIGRDRVRIAASKLETTDTALSSYILFPSIPTPGVQGGSPDIPDNIFNEGKKRLDMQDYNTAVQLFDRALNLTRGTVYAQRSLLAAGQAFYDEAESTGREDLYRQSAKYFEQLMKNYPNAYLPLTLIRQAADAERNSFNYIRSIELYTMLLSLAPDVASQKEATLDLADTNLMQGNLQEALAIYEKFTDNYPKDSMEILPKLGFLYEQQNLHVVSNYYYDRFDIYEPILDNYSDEILLSMYNSYRKRGKSEKATQMSQYILKTSRENPTAFAYVTYEQAKIYEKLGDTVQRDKLFLECIDMYPEAEYCKRSSWEYALAHLEEREYNYWRGFFGVNELSDLGKFDDEVFYILTLSMLQSGDYKGVIDAVDLFHSKYDTSKRYNDQSYLKEEAIFKTGVELYANGKTDDAKNIMALYYKTYPDGAFIDSLYAVEDEESYTYVSKLVEDGHFLDAMSAAQSYTMNRRDLLTNSTRWDDLFRQAYYLEVKDKLAMTGNDAQTVGLAMAKDFEENYANETYNDVGEVVDTLLYSSINELYNKGLYGDVLDIFNRNKEYIALSQNKTLTAGTGILLGLSLINMDNYDEAAGIYYQIPPDDGEKVDSRLYTALGLIIGDENPDPNIFNENEMDFVVNNVAKRNRDDAYRLAQKYTRNASHALAMKYKLYSGETDNVKKLVMVESLYADLTNNQAVTFDNAHFVYLDYGVSRYDQGRYGDAIASLSTFIRMYRQTDDATAQGLYFLAKSYHNMGDIERAQVYYEMVGENAPSSIYANLAQSELSSTQWRSGVSRQ